MGSGPAEPARRANLAAALVAERDAEQTSETVEGRIVISLLGPFMLRGVARRRGLRSATEQLIAYLALHPEGASRDELLEALWPEQDPRRTRPRLWQSVTQARKVLGDQAFVRDRDRYRIDLDLVEVDLVDLVDLDRLIADAERAEQPAERRRLLEQALSLVRGQPLINIDLPWADEAARRLKSTIVTLLEAVGRARLADGDLRLAIDAAEQGLALDGLNESLWRVAMEAEAALGLRESIDRRYERLRRTLVDRVGLEPSRETRALHRRLLGQD